MSTVIGSRHLTGEERARLKAPWLPPAIGAGLGALGRFVLFFLLTLMAGGTLVAIVAAAGDKWFPGFDPGPWEPLLIALIIVIFWGPVLIVPVAIAIRAYLRIYRRGSAIRDDLRDGRVEILEIDDARSVTLVDHRQWTYFLIDLGQGRTLLLDAYGLPRKHSDLDGAQIEDGRDGLEDADADDCDDCDFEPLRRDFPNSRFALHRLPRTGRILRLDVHGHPTHPSRVLLSNEIASAPIRKALLQDGVRSFLLQQDFEAI